VFLLTLPVFFLTFSGPFGQRYSSTLGHSGVLRGTLRTRLGLSETFRGIFTTSCWTRGAPRGLQGSSLGRVRIQKCLSKKGDSGPLYVGGFLPDKHSPSPVASLASEKPATLMAQLRAVWPDVERALNVGHTLRVVHRRLNQMGIPITYRRLTVYRGRLQR